MPDPDYRDIDEIIHGRLRLCILILLRRHGEMDFSALRDALDTTDGNLITHLRRLEEAQYLRGRREDRQTRYRLTPTGRRAFRRYRRHLRDLLGSD